MRSEEEELDAIQRDDTITGLQRWSAAGAGPTGITGWLRGTGAVQQAIVFAIIFAGWQLAVETGVISRLLLPTPVDIAAESWRTVISVLSGGFMLKHFMTTLQEVVFGFAGAIAIGITLGALISEFKVVRQVLMPYVVAFNSSPKIAFAPIFLIWFGFGIGRPVRNAEFIRRCSPASTPTTSALPRRTPSAGAAGRP